MANFSIKMLVSYLQRRSLQTTTSNLPIISRKFVANVAEIPTKTKEPEEAKLAAAEGENEKSVIALLKSHQFSETHIAKIIERLPGILKCRVASNLEPKFKYLKENGLKGSVLPDIIVSNPSILRRSLDAHLVPAIEFLKTQLGKNNEGSLQQIIKRASWLLTLDLEKVLPPNISLLEKEGMPMSSIMKLFISQPRCLLRSSERLLQGVEMVKKFGIKPYEPMFQHALRVVVSMDEVRLKRKVEVFKSLGWSDEDITSTIIRQPLCLTCSEDKLRCVMKFLVKTMKIEPELVITHPKLIMYSLDKRIIPRCKVLKVLQEKELLGKRKLASILNLPEEDFIRRYIIRYLNEVPHLLDVYRGNWVIDALAVKQ